MAKNDNNKTEYVQTRSMKLNKESKDFPIVLTIDGSTAEGLNKADNPVILALMFSAFAVQVASAVRSAANKKDAKLTIVDMQNIASSARPKIGKFFDPIKKKDRVISDMAKSVPHMSEEEKAELKKLLG